MHSIFSWIFLFSLIHVQAKFHTKKIDPSELKCLVCQTAVKELNEAVSKIDPTRQMDVGGYRIDPQGNLKQKKVSLTKSEIHLSELADKVCDTMDNYIRGTWKDDGRLTVFQLIENGQMSPKFNLVDIIQDDDLNKSLKYYCEEIMEVHEEQIVKHFIDDIENIVEAVCRDHTKYCTDDDFIEREHVEVPGTEDDFSKQFGGFNQGQFNLGEDQIEPDEPALDDIEIDDLKDEL